MPTAPSAAASLPPVRLLSSIAATALLVIASAALALQATPPPSAPSSVSPAPRTDDWAVARQNDVLRRVREAKGPVPVVFVGDSITQGWESAGSALWTSAIAPLGAVNLGVSGDRTEHVLWRLEQAPLTALEPKVVVLMIGTNNLGSGTSGAADTALGVRAIVDRLATQCPKAKILLLGIFPRGATMNPMRGDCCQINQSLARFADDHPSKRVEFLDIGPRFLEIDGTIPASVMPDELHLSEEGYQRWLNAVLPRVAPLARAS